MPQLTPGLGSCALAQAAGRVEALMQMRRLLAEKHVIGM